MTYQIKTLSILCVAAIICSCSKPIEGKLIDNFGIPIANAEIKIKDSEFKAVSNDKGEFNIDYVPGKLEISFSKDGHIGESKILEISEKSKYPIGTLELIRLPKEPGMFIKDSVDYVLLPKFKLLKEAKSNKTFLGRVDMIVYSVMPDSIRTIAYKPSELTVFQYKIASLHLMTPTAQNVLIVTDRFGSFPQKWLNDQGKQASAQLLIRTFTPERNKIYVYAQGTIHKNVLGTSLKNISTEVYAFKY